MIITAKQDTTLPSGRGKIKAGQKVYLYKNKGSLSTWILCLGKSRMTCIETVGAFFIGMLKGETPDPRL